MNGMRYVTQLQNNQSIYIYYHYFIMWKQNDRIRKGKCNNLRHMPLQFIVILVIKVIS